MSRALVSATLLASGVLAQECTLDTAAERCAALDLIKPAPCPTEGQWVCSSDSRCVFKCEDSLVTADTTQLCPDKTTKVLEALAACAGDFNAVDCSCVMKEEPVCPNGKLVRQAAEECFAQGGKLTDATTCQCQIDVVVEPVDCSSLVVESCNKIGGELTAAPMCECQQKNFCADGSSFVEMAEKCKSAYLDMNPDTCECIDRIEPVDQPVEQCKYARDDGNFVSVDMASAEKECSNRGDDYRFMFDADTTTCKCQRFALTADSLCPDSFGPVTIEFARKTCEGMFAYPRTANFMPDTCKCEPIPVDQVEKIDCTYFPTCTKDTPCFSREKGACVAGSAAGDCPDNTLMCQAFGISGEVCPNGIPYEMAKKLCVEKGAPEKARFDPDSCRCEAIVLTTACAGEDFEVQWKKCEESGGYWMADSCTCTQKTEATCTSVTDYAKAKEECMADGSKFFVDLPHCECVTKTERPTTEGCKDFTSIEEALRMCKGAMASPATQVFDKASCECSDILDTKPMMPVEPFKADVKLKICRDGLTADEVKMSLVKIMNSVQAMLALSYPEARIAFNDLALEGSCVGISITVVHPDKAILSEILDMAKAMYADNVQFQDAIRFSLETPTSTNDAPVALALEVVGEISGGDAAFASAPIDKVGVSGASVAVPAVSALAMFVALFF